MSLQVIDSSPERKYTTYTKLWGDDGTKLSGYGLAGSLNTNQWGAVAVWDEENDRMWVGGSNSAGYVYAKISTGEQDLTQTGIAGSGKQYSSRWAQTWGGESPYTLRSRGGKIFVMSWVDDAIGDSYLTVFYEGEIAWETKLSDIDATLLSPENISVSPSGRHIFIADNGSNYCIMLQGS